MTKEALIKYPTYFLFKYNSVQQF